MPEHTYTHFPEEFDSPEMFICNDCGAYDSRPEDVKHFPACTPGESERWREYNDTFYLKATNEWLTICRKAIASGHGTLAVKHAPPVHADAADIYECITALRDELAEVLKLADRTGGRFIVSGGEVLEI